MAFLIELFQENVELGLRLQDVGPAGRVASFFKVIWATAMLASSMLLSQYEFRALRPHLT